MVTQKRQFGDLGEEFAAKYLKQKGYKILERNWRQKWGEIDIVAAKTSGIFKQKIEAVIFVEVKTTKDNSTALAAQNVHFAKQQRLIRTAQTYLAEKKLLALPWQIDILLIDLESTANSAKIEHLPNAVWENKKPPF